MSYDALALIPLLSYFSYIVIKALVEASEETDNDNIR